MKQRKKWQLFTSDGQDAIGAEVVFEPARVNDRYVGPYLAQRVALTLLAALVDSGNVVDGCSDVGNGSGQIVDISFVCAADRLTLNSHNEHRS